MGNLPLYIPLPTPIEMKEWDNMSSDIYGISEDILMENAGRAVASAIVKEAPVTEENTILIMAGKGNNGGDGFVIARILHSLGAQVFLCLYGDEEGLPPVAKNHLIRAKNTGVPFLALDGSPPFDVIPLFWQQPTIFIDALIGTGTNKELRWPMQELISLLNEKMKKSFIVSVDVPSGLNALTGQASPIAIQANCTVTLQAGKPGLFFPHARKYTGKIIVREIGMPQPILSQKIPPSWNLISPHKGRWAQPKADMNKGTAGKVFVIGGSQGMAGAPVLSCLGALRAGAGLTALLAPAQTALSTTHPFPEIVTHPCGSTNDWTDKALVDALDAIKKNSPSCIVIGPGIGRSENIRELLCALLSLKNRCPVLIDADALFFMQISDENTSPFAYLTEKDILTPHPKEMAGLLPEAFFTDIRLRSSCERSSTSCVQFDRKYALDFFLQRSKATLLLKGVGTIIGQQGLPTALLPLDQPSLAIPGSGDILSGVIGALLAYGYPPYEAASLGAYLHGRAGVLLSRTAPRGHLAHEISEMLPEAMAELVSSESSMIEDTLTFSCSGTYDYN